MMLGIQIHEPCYFMLKIAPIISTHCATHIPAQQSTTSSDEDQHYSCGMYTKVQRKSVLQPAIQASCSQHVLAHKSFLLAPKPFLISRIDNNPSVI